MLNYADIDKSKKGYIFELDDVLYPERDYLLQVYYLFANFIEFTETVPTSNELVSFLKSAYENHGSDGLFERASQMFGIDEKYKENFTKLHHTARLPLKLVLYPHMLSLLQEMVIDRKQIFVVTNGDPEVQLNKIRQVEWNGLEQYLVVYFADEIKPKPQTDVLEYILGKHQLLRKELVVLGRSDIDEEFASAAGVDFVDSNDFSDQNS
ncbi:HAD hydrolase-like protein [Flavihumibacter sp. R14]|nr:HAD hydrolase-like protein [Flavihumibacter soli]